VGEEKGENPEVLSPERGLTIFTALVLDWVKERKERLGGGEEEKGGPGVCTIVGVVGGVEGEAGGKDKTRLLSMAASDLHSINRTVATESLARIPVAHKRRGVIQSSCSNRNKNLENRLSGIKSK
jgi:hypothetical protein